jgi:peptide/nickel transport system permease protein
MAVIAAPIPARAAPRRRARLITTLGPSGVASAAVLAIVFAVALLAPVLAPSDPSQPDLINALAGPSAAHPLGTDALGRDLLSRLIYGARTALFGPALVIAFSSVAGTAIGIGAAWAGGVVDGAISRALDVLFAIPGIVFALVATALFGAGLTSAVGGLAIAYVPYVARIVRGAALRERSLPYVDAAWCQGQSGASICRRHLLPNLRPLIVAQSVAAVGFAIMDLAAVSFLGLGVQPPAADWGLMIKSGLESVLRGQPYEAIWAGAAIVVVVAAFNVLADRLTARAEGR